MSLKTISRKELDAVLGKAIKLDRCPYCHNSGEINVKMPWYGKTGASVRCTKCGFSTGLHMISSSFVDDSGRLATPFTIGSIMRGIKEAIHEWNGGASSESGGI